MSMREIANIDTFPKTSYKNSHWPIENWFQLPWPGIEREYLPKENEVEDRFGKLRILIHPDKRPQDPQLAHVQCYALIDAKENLLKQIRCKNARKEYIAHQAKTHGSRAELLTSPESLADTTPDWLVVSGDIKLPQNVEVYFWLDGDLHLVQLTGFDKEKDAFEFKSVSLSALNTSDLQIIVNDLQVKLQVKPSALYRRFFTFEYVFCENRISKEKVDTKFRLMFNTHSNITVISKDVAEKAGLLQQVISLQGGQQVSCGVKHYEKFIHGSQLMSCRLPFKYSAKNIEYGDEARFVPRVGVALFIRGVRLVCSVVINTESNADEEDADVYLGRADWNKFRDLSSLEFEATPPVSYSKELREKD